MRWWSSRPKRTSRSGCRPQGWISIIRGFKIIKIGSPPASPSGGTTSRWAWHPTGEICSSLPIWSCPSWIGRWMLRPSSKHPPLSSRLLKRFIASVRSFSEPFFQFSNHFSRLRLCWMDPTLSFTSNTTAFKSVAFASPRRGPSTGPWVDPCSSCATNRPKSLPNRSTRYLHLKIKFSFWN